MHTAIRKTGANAGEAPGAGTVAMSPVLTSPAGGNAAVPVMQPCVTVHCFIAMEGIFPSRN